MSVTSEPNCRSDRRHGLAAWFEGALGATLLAKESEVLMQGVRRCHGDAMLWLSPVTWPADALDRCMVRHRFFAAVGASDDLGSSPDSTCLCRADMRELPLPPGSMDAIVVHHGLDCTPDPRGALREVVKALRPGGRLLLCGFNPVSLWGARRWFGAWRRSELRAIRFVSPWRLLDWLAVLGVEVDQRIEFLLFRPPSTRMDFDAPWLARVRRTLVRSHLPVGGVYFVLGRKTAVRTSMTPDPALVRAGKLAPALPLSSARSPS